MRILRDSWKGEVGKAYLKTHEFIERQIKKLTEVIGKIKFILKGYS